MLETTVKIPGYKITEEIYISQRTLVYKGIREYDQNSVIIKLMHSDYPNFNEVVQFRNQYTITKNLGISGIVKPYSLEPYNNGYALIMEDFGGISLKEWGMGSGELGVGSGELTIEKKQAIVYSFLDVAIKIVSTLSELHRQRIIHKDIKPANILINPDTKEVKLIDFSISSLLPREMQQLQNPNVIEGTLSYISPEQTGRMNRGIDYRTDFYSLGVSFYELLTGKLPFICDEPMELMYCHIAEQAEEAHRVNPNIPEAISNIITKMMAKNAEERYQSALGLKYDLNICLSEYQKTGDISQFGLGSRDISERFLIPEKLYGREVEVGTLMEAFARVSAGSSEIMLVAGFSGIGKTAVVNEVHKPIVRQRGYFIKGKYDQFQRNIPFSAFVQAFQDLMMQLLGESDTQLRKWKRNILQALGENGQVIIEVIPELEKIIGKQSSVPQLNGSASQNRFNLLFQKFIQVFTVQEHPLIIFLDDLQWADLESLKLMQLLMSEHTSYLLLIGAYRDNEVYLAHPLILILDEMKKTGVVINTIILSALNKISLNYLVADTLSCLKELALPLTEIIYQNTKGNPFFLNQFLKSLYEDDLIIFNWQERYWECDIAKIKTLALTDDVVEFMAIQLLKLPQETQDVLKLAACIGSQFDLTTLAIVDEKSLEETATDLWKALQEGLILPSSHIYKFFGSGCDVQLKDDKSVKQKNKFTIDISYRFLHDRVQQAAYSLISDNEKQATHLKIGKLLLNNTPTNQLEGHIFEIINQFNIGLALIYSQVEKDELAHLNLIAGRKAKVATAYTSAINYFQIGRELLANDSWERNYDLTLSLYEESAQTAYLNTDFELAFSLVEIILGKSTALFDKVRAYEVKIQVYKAQLQLKTAIKTAIEVLNELGVNLPKSPNKLYILLQILKVNLVLGGRKPLDLLDIPQMNDTSKLAAMKILSSIIAAAYIAAPELLPLIPTEQLKLSLKYGNAPESADAYSSYGVILCNFLGQIESGYEFGQLAVKLLDKYNNKEVKARVIKVVAGFISHWKEPISNRLDTLITAYSIGIETGYSEEAATTISIYCYALYFSAEELTSFFKEISNYANVVKKLKQETALHSISMLNQVAFNLSNTLDEPFRLIGESYDEVKMFPLHQKSNDRTSIYLFSFHKLTLHYLFAHYSQAVENAELGEKYINSNPGGSSVSPFHLYSSLAQLAVYPSASRFKQKQIIAKVASNQKKMKKWAHHAPMNNLHKYYLVEAEKHRVLNKKKEAIEFYDSAIYLAKENKYIQEEALANELAAKFYLEWGKEKIAQSYMVEAYYCYTRWGAKSKVEHLEKKYSELLAPILKRKSYSINTSESINKISTSPNETKNPTITSVFDLVGITKVSQAISSEIKLEKLLSTLMQVIIENTGAKKSALILLKDNNLQIEVISHYTQKKELSETILQSIPLESSQEVPHTIINYVKNSLTTLIITDAVQETNWALDPYIQQEQPKSILCTPAIKGGKLIGILYLENRLTVGAFTNDRVQLVNQLVSQAAISLENARLYKIAQHYAQEAIVYAQQSEESLSDLKKAQLQLVQSEKMSALGNLVSGVAHEINNPIGFISGNIEPAFDYVNDLFGLLDLYQNKFPNPGDEIEAEIETIDLEYIREDLPKLLSSMTQGVERIRSISNSLRTFSRADTERKVAFNIHDGLDSTLMILKHRLKANESRPEVQVIKNYAELPQIQCFPGQLNQVFMNLLANAIDALDESNSGLSFQEINQNPNQITITTKISTTEINDQVVISIKDNGKGISDEIQQRIFDHLFTTKAVGTGTGLGLAIARQIIMEKHDGSIEVNSTPGLGAEFVLTLPV
ncbi:MAG: AAA family ATPase [Scytonematopsis contorta HA4267-MV1]|jgi:predicted ATPase/signal transduction histidine kinase/tRNA A-37 threonylcarbamoyl transferase component Bud32|nr:AAA family ATPase [Scytonematopsis contorta HA4267-MV1]